MIMVHVIVVLWLRARYHFQAKPISAIRTRQSILCRRFMRQFVVTVQPLKMFVKLCGVLIIALFCGKISAQEPPPVARVQITTPRPPITDAQLVRQFVNSVLSNQNNTLPTGNRTVSDVARSPVNSTATAPQRNARQDSELMKQLKMQFVLDCALTDEKGVPVSASHRPPIYNIMTRAPTTLPYVPSTVPPPTASKPSRPHNVDDDDDENDSAPFEAVQDVVGSVYGMVEQSFDGADADNGDNESSDLDSEEDEEDEAVQPEQPAPTEPTPFGTTRRLPQHEQQLQYPMPLQSFPQSQPTIIYALPNSIPAGYYQEDDNSHRNKRTTFAPYGNYYHPGSYVKGPHQFITANTVDAGGLDPNRNGYLSTQFQVTSAYNPPPTSAELLRRKKGNRGDSSEEGDEYGFYDAVDLSGLNVEPEGDDDDDDESESKSDESSDDDDEDDDDASNAFPSGVNRINRQKDKKRNPRIPMRPQYGSYDDGDDNEIDDDDRDDDDEDSVEKANTPSSFFDEYFGNFFRPISWMWPASKSSSSSFSLWSPFRMFTGRRSNEATAKTARSKMLSRRSSIYPRSAKKKPIMAAATTAKVPQLDNGNGIETGPDVQAFFDSLQSSAELDEMDAIAATEATSIQTQDSDEKPLTGFWAWWYGTSVEDMESDMAITTTTIVPMVDKADGGWNVFNMFGESTTETPPQITAPAPTVVSASPTRRPFMSIADPVKNPATWLGILAQHLATSVVKTPASHQPAALEGAGAKMKRVNYANWQLWRLRPETAEAVHFLEEYKGSEAGSELLWWRGPTLKGSTDIAVPPSQLDDLRDALSDESIAHDVVMWDLAKAILYSNPDQSRIERAANAARNGHPLTWHRYHRYADIVRFMEYLQRNRSDIVELMHIGRSFEGRPLTVVRVAAEERVNPVWKRKRGKGGGKGVAFGRRSPKRSVFIEAGAHGREWIGPAAATWMLQRLVERIDGNDTLGETLRMFDWYVMPVLNPDGYEHSHVYDRFWRKTRSKHAPHGVNSLFAIAMNWMRQQPAADDHRDKTKCIGTDPNRNWDHEWNRADEDSSNFQTDCSEFYPGPQAFSEPETRAVAAFLKENRKHLKMFISLHAYGQTISYPAAKNATSSNASSNTSNSDDALYDMAHVAVEAMRTSMQKPNSGHPASWFGTGAAASMVSPQKYSIDNGAESRLAQKRHVGRADAYAMNGPPHIKYAYTLDLRDSGTHGFLLPPSNIEAVGREVFELVRGMVDFM